MATFPPAVLAHLVRHHGLVSRQHLLSLGGNRRTVDSWVLRGELEVVQRGVYRLPGAPVPVEQPLYAAALRTGGLLTGEPALALLQVRGCERTAAPVVAVQRGRAVSGVTFRIVSHELGRADRCRVGVIPLAAPTLATFDAMAGVPDDRARSIVDAVRWRRTSDLGRLRTRAAGLPRHPGARRFRLLDRAGAFAVDSEGERVLDAFLGPFTVFFRPQADDVIPGRRLDRYDDVARLGLEYHGRDDHTVDDDRAADGLRELEIRDAGDIEVLSLTYGMITGMAAVVTLARILSIRARRVARLVAP